MGLHYLLRHSVKLKFGAEYNGEIRFVMLNVCRRERHTVHARDCLAGDLLTSR
jgi:hypothetical protein